MGNQTVTLKLSAEDVSMLLRFTVLPLPFKRLKLEKTLSCKLIGQTGSHVIPEKFCHKADTEGQGYSIRCLPSSTEIIVWAEASTISLAFELCTERSSLRDAASMAYGMRS